MRKPLLGSAIALNLFASLYFGWAWVRSYCSSLDIAIRYTELDRSGVINHEALAKYSPSLEENDRYNVPKWIAERTLAAERRNAGVGCIVAAINAIAGVGVLISLRGKAQSRASAREVLA
jgi:hypothetical protein